MLIIEVLRRERMHISFIIHYHHHHYHHHHHHHHLLFLLSAKKENVWFFNSGISQSGIEPSTTRSQYKANASTSYACKLFSWFDMIDEFKQYSIWKRVSKSNKTERQRWYSSRATAPRAGCRGFDPWPRYTKVVIKMVPDAFLLAISI